MPAKATFAKRLAALMIALCVVASFGLTGCGGDGDGKSAAGAAASAMQSTANKLTEDTDGSTFKARFTSASFDSKKAKGNGNAQIDVSSVNAGYVGAKAKSGKRLKFQVISGGTTYNYDLPSDKATLYPINLGDGSYTFNIMQNTTENRYALVYSATANVKLKDEFAPFVIPNMFCQYAKDSASVAKAIELTSGAANQGDALAAVYNYVVDNITYDKEKAAALASQSGYVPDPDDTLATGKGICFDYSSLCAAMLRSLGIPCQIITGYVGENDIYHAWNMVYIDGEWHAINIDVKRRTWTRVDTTFAASGALSTVGDGTSYKDRYVY